MGEVLTKAEFAERIGKSRARISQLVAEGKISGPALVGVGRSARIDVDIAMQQLAATLDVVQQVAQGQAPGMVGASAGPVVSDAQERYLRARAETAELQLRRGLAEEEEAAGRWMLTAEAEATWSRELAAFVQAAETWLVTTAAADVAALPAPSLRDVSQALRGGFRAFRDSWASVMARRSAAAEGAPDEDGGDDAEADDALPG